MEWADLPGTGLRMIGVVVSVEPASTPLDGEEAGMTECGGGDMGGERKSGDPKCE